MNIVRLIQVSCEEGIIKESDCDTLHQAMRRSFFAEEGDISIFASKELSSFIFENKHLVEGFTGCKVIDMGHNDKKGGRIITLKAIDKVLN